MRRFYYLLMLILSLFGCGGAAERIPEQPPLTFEVPPTPVFTGTCDTPAALEAWLQTISLRYREFDVFLANAVDQNARQLYDDVMRMGRIVTIVSETHAPECAADAHQTMLGAMGFTAGRFQEYVNGDADNLRAIIEQARVQFEPALAQRDALLELLDSLYQQG